MDDSKRHNDFELISAYIDGRVTDAERARIESDPKLMNEVHQILSISKKVGKIVPNDPETKAIHIQAALNEMPVNLPDSVIPIRNANKRSSFFARPARILGAVAAAILVIIAIPLFRSGDSSTTQIASENLEKSDTEQVPESAPVEEREQRNDGADLEESAPLNSSQNETATDREKEGEIATDIDLTEDNEPDISENIEESQNEKLTSGDPSAAGLQAVTTLEEPIRRGPVNTYTSDNPNEYDSYLLQDVRIETGEEFDTFIIQLTATDDDPPSMAPGPYAIRLNDENFVQEESPRSVPEDIYEHLVIEISGRGGTWTTEEEYEPSWGSFEQRIEAEGSVLTGIYFGDFESTLTFVLGIESGSSFRSFQTLEPPRLIIEVDHIVGE